MIFNWLVSSKVLVVGRSIVYLLLIIFKNKLFYVRGSIFFIFIFSIILASWQIKEAKICILHSCLYTTTNYTMNCRYSRNDANWYSIIPFSYLFLPKYISINFYTSQYTNYILVNFPHIQYFNTYILYSNSKF